MDTLVNGSVVALVTMSLGDKVPHQKHAMDGNTEEKLKGVVNPSGDGDWGDFFIYWL